MFTVYGAGTWKLLKKKGKTRKEEDFNGPGPKVQPIKTLIRTTYTNAQMQQTLRHTPYYYNYCAVRLRRRTLTSTLFSPPSAITDNVYFIHVCVCVCVFVYLCEIIRNEKTLSFVLLIPFVTRTFHLFIPFHLPPPL